MPQFDWIESEIYLVYLGDNEMEQAIQIALREDTVRETFKQVLKSSRPF